MFRPVYIAAGLALLVGGIAAVAFFNRPPAPEAQTTGGHPELTRNPAMIFKPEFRSRGVTVYGIAIRDDVASIPAAEVRSREENTVYMKSGIALAVEGGKVEWIVVPTQVFEKWNLKVRSVDDAKARFGQPDPSTNDDPPPASMSRAVELEYNARGVVVFVFPPNQVGVRLR
ncbi:MAG TPA: hypothetical protein VK986_14495 [Tepidisphaeraceae bacterium]|nr:hypothetical protein [Tepidisphaeraceae bacterium]